MPGLVVLTVVTNCLICAILLTKSMRTPTNLLLVAMAVSDMFTGLSTMPAFLYFYTLGAYVDYMPFSWSVYRPGIDLGLHLFQDRVKHGLMTWVQEEKSRTVFRGSWAGRMSESDRSTRN